MHSLWQEGMEYPYYNMITSDKKVDILYIGATLEHAVDAHFQMQAGKKVMIIEEQTISQMSELGGMGIIKARNREEEKDLHRLQDYIYGREIPCDMEVQTKECIWVHPIKLFLFLTQDMDVFEQVKVSGETEGKVDIGTTWIEAKEVVHAKEKESLYVHVFACEKFPEIEGSFDVMRKYKEYWLIGNQEEELKLEEYHWKI